MSDRPIPETNTLVHFDRLTGSLKAISTDLSAGFDIEVNGRFAGIFQADSLPSRPTIINRIIDSALDLPEPHWLTVEYSMDAPVKKNISPEWTLEDGNTAYLMSTPGSSEEPVMATFHCPIEGADLSVAEGQAYTFQALFGLHRTDGRVRLSFRDAEAEEIQAFEKAIPLGALGGRKAEEYVPLRLSVRAPAGAATMRIEIIKGLTASGPDSFLFFAQPALTRTADAIAYGLLENELPDVIVTELFRSTAERLQVCSIPLPGEALDGNLNRLALRNRATGAVSNHTPVSLPAAIACKCELHGLEGSTLIGRIRPSSGVEQWRHAVLAD